MYTKYDLVPSLARPLVDGCFQLFTIDRDRDHILHLKYEMGGKASAKKVNTVTDALYRALVMEVSFRQGMIDIWGDEDFVFDHLHESFYHRVYRVWDAFRKAGVTFVLLRGSEVSLDRLVQLEESLPLTPSL